MLRIVVTVAWMKLFYMKWNEIVFKLFWVYIVMYCENCGVFFEQAANFCRVCGKGKNVSIF